jgi:hypothetical protein
MLNFLYPTKDQMISYVGTVAKWIGAGLATRGVTVSPDIASVVAGPEAIQFYAGIVMMLVPVIRDRFIHSDAGKLAAASALAVGPDPQIKPIVPLPTAAPAIAALANDPNVPGVQPAAPTYVPPTASVRR